MAHYVRGIAAACAAVLAFAAAPALADGVPGKGVHRAVETPAAFSWSGFYVGGNIGGGWADRDHNVTFPNGNTERFSFDSESFAGGVQAGVQRQFGHVVLGLEAGLTGFDFAESKPSLTAIANRSRTSDIDWLFTLTPRIGYAVNNWMVYLKGGYANAEVFHGTTATSTGQQITGNNRLQQGWTLGTGFEVAVAPWVSLGLDYSYVNLDMKARGSQFVLNNGPIGTTINSDPDIHLLTARINFKLGK